jgi:hypothetical protein
MPQASPVYFWEANVTIECQNLAFSLEATDEGRGATKKRIFSANWAKDGKVRLDPSKRMGGWLKKQLPLLRSSYATQVQAIKVYPANGQQYVDVCELSELKGSDIPIPDANHEFLQKFANPLWQRIQVPNTTGTGTRSTTTYWLEYPKPTQFQVKIISFARSITPEIIKEALTKLGYATGIGDKYSQGYGRFKLIKFDAKSEKMNL